VHVHTELGTQASTRTKVGRL